jgi:hypothetical protein
VAKALVDRPSVTMKGTMGKNLQQVSFLYLNRRQGAQHDLSCGPMIGRRLMEGYMGKHMRTALLVLGIAVLGTMCWSDAGFAMLAANGIRITNGIKLGNGQALSNTTALQPVRLALPDGTEVNFR